MRRAVLLLLLSLIVLSSWGSASATSTPGKAGDLDRSFGRNGVAATTFRGLTDESAADFVGLSDGGLIVVGTTTNYGLASLVVTRLDASGQPDGSFGSGGSRTLRFGGDTMGAALAVQPDGKVLAGGARYVDGRWQPLIVRVDENGVLDPGFGAGGKVFESFGSVRHATVEALAVLPNGRIVATGFNRDNRTSGVFVARFHADGSRDVSFATDGVVLPRAAIFNEYSNGLAILPDGAVVACGRVSTVQGSEFGLLRLTSAGKVDTSFGIGGLATTLFRGSYCDPADVALQADGRIVVAGYTNDDSTGTIGVARFMPDGQLDKSFGTAGMNRLTIGNYSDASSVVVRRDGSILVGASATDYFDARESDLVVVCLDTDGQLSPGFGADGIARFDYARSFEIAAAVVLLPSDEIVIGGETYQNSGADFVAAKLDANVELDLRFGIEGFVTAGLTGVGNDSAWEGVIQPDGRIVVVGDTTAGESGRHDLGVTRLLPDGQPDPTFGVDGCVVTDFGTSGYEGATGVVMQADGRIIVVGNAGSATSHAVPIVVRYLTDGRLDSTFGDGGKAIAPLCCGFGNDVAIRADGRIVVLAENLDEASTVALYGLDRDGQPDTSFGNGGVALFDTGLREYPRELQILQDNRVVVAGLAVDDRVGRRVSFLLRLLPDGSSDPLFGTGGLVLTEFGEGDGAASAVAIQVDGRIVTAGDFLTPMGKSDSLIVRYNVDGSLDESFGVGGSVVTNLGRNDGFVDILVGPDGTLIAAGQVSGKNGVRCVLARFMPDGRLDRRFGHDGVVRTRFGTYDDSSATTVLAARDGGLVVVGSALVPERLRDFVVARFSGRP